MKTIAVAMACVGVLAAPSIQKAKTPIARVYLFTASTDSDATPANLKDCDNAVSELRDALAKKKGITLVEDRADSDMQLEVVSCETRDMGGGGFGGKAITPFDEKIIHIHAVSPADQADFKGTAPGYWGRAAKDAADRLAKWIARQPKGGSNGG